MYDSRRLWVTTEDNPFDPFTQGDRWNQWDMSHGYKTKMKLADISRCSIGNLSAEENRIARNQACIDLCRDDTRNFVFSIDGKYRFYYHLCEYGKTVPWGVTEEDDDWVDKRLSGFGLITNGVHNMN